MTPQQSCDRHLQRDEWRSVGSPLLNHILITSILIATVRSVDGAMHLLLMYGTTSFLISISPLKCALLISCKGFVPQLFSLSAAVNKTLAEQQKGNPIQQHKERTSPQRKSVLTTVLCQRPLCNSRRPGFCFFQILISQHTGKGECNAKQHVKKQEKKMTALMEWT